MTNIKAYARPVGIFPKHKFLNELCEEVVYRVIIWFFYLLSVLTVSVFLKAVKREENVEQLDLQYQ